MSNITKNAENNQKCRMLDGVSAEFEFYKFFAHSHTFP